MKWIKRLVSLLVLSAVVAAFVYAFRPQPVRVEFEKVIRGPMKVTIDEEGETRIRERFIVSTPVAGRISRIELQPGDRVTAGSTTVATLIASQAVLLDARTRAESEARVTAAESAIGRARANRDRAKEDLDFAETQRTRYTKLVEEGLAPRERRDTAEADVRAKQEMLRVAEFEVRDAERNVDVARASLVQSSEDAGGAGIGQVVTIRPPVDGVVLRRLRESEGTVPAGEPLVEIGDTRRIEIVSDLLSADAVRVGVGSRVLIEQWGGGATLEGTVRRVEPSGFTKLSALGVEEQRVNVVIGFDDPAAAKALGDGYRVEVRIVTWESPDVLKVPTSSLFRRDGVWSVYTSGADGKAVVQHLDIGHRNGLEAEVLSGLAELDQVVVHPSEDVAAGIKIAPR